MNTYYKYAPNVFLAKCESTHGRGELVTLSTRHGKENDVIIHNLIFQKNGFNYYSFVREDGFNSQEWAKRRAKKRKQQQDIANDKSNEHYNKSRKDSDFLSMAEPIKVGHHSERRHRKAIEQAQNNATKSVEYMRKADSLDSKIEYWQSKSKEINLSMPESLEYFESLVDQCKRYHSDLKSGKAPRQHSYSLTYAKKALNDAETKLALAKKLWD